MRRKENVEYKKSEYGREVQDRGIERGEAIETGKRGKRKQKIMRNRKVGGGGRGYKTLRNRKPIIAKDRKGKKVKVE